MSNRHNTPYRSSGSGEDTSNRSPAVHTPTSLDLSPGGFNLLGAPSHHQHFQHHRVEVLNHSSFSLLRPASPVHTPHHGTPSPAVVSTTSTHASGNMHAHPDLDHNNSNNHRHSTPPDMATHNDKVLAPTSFLRRYLRMLHRNASVAQDPDTAMVSSRSTSPTAIDQPNPRPIRSNSDLSAAAYRNQETDMDPSAHNAGHSLAGFERFAVADERRGRSLSEQIRDERARNNNNLNESDQDRYQRLHRHNDLFAAPLVDLDIDTTPVMTTLARRHLNAAGSSGGGGSHICSPADGRSSPSTTPGPLRIDTVNISGEGSPRWRTDKLSVMPESCLVEVEHGTHLLASQLPSPCSSQASTVSTVSSPVCGTSFTGTTDSSIGGRSRPMDICQTPPVSARHPQRPRGNNHNGPTIRREPSGGNGGSRSLRPKARTIGGHKRRVSVQPAFYSATGSAANAASQYSRTSLDLPLSATVPRVSAASYDGMQASPAVSFLSMFAQGTCGPTDEEAEILREEEAGDEVGGYVLGRELSRGTFSTVREAYHIEDTKVRIGPVVVKTVRHHNASVHMLRANSQQSEGPLSAPVARPRPHQRTMSVIDVSSAQHLRASHGDTAAATAATTSDDDDEGSAIAAMRRELLIWRRLNHPNVLPLLDSFESPIALYAVSPRCSGGSLFHAIHGHRNQLGHEVYNDYEDDDSLVPRGLPIEVARRVTAQLASALRYLHDDASVVHGDLKLENVLLDADGHVKLIDFGLSRELFDDPSRNSTSATDSSAASAPPCQPCTAAGSLPYCSPELIRGAVPSVASDCWAFGVIVYACIMGRLPFQDAYEPRLVYKIINAQYTLPPTDESADGGDSGMSDWFGGSASALCGSSSPSSSSATVPASVCTLIEGLLHTAHEARWKTHHVAGCDWLDGVDPTEPTGFVPHSTPANHHHNHHHSQL